MERELESMGFPAALCREAVRRYPASLQMALEWILATQQGGFTSDVLEGATTSRDGPVLRLPTVQPDVAPWQESARWKLPASSSSSSSTQSPSLSSSRQPADSSAVPFSMPPANASRDPLNATTDTQPSTTNEDVAYTRRQVEKTQLQLRKDKLEKEKERQRILNEIQLDRERRKALTGSAGGSGASSSSSGQVLAPITSQSTAPPPPPRALPAMATIQIRHRDGTCRRRQFPKEARISALFAFVKEMPSEVDPFQLLQPIAGRRVFDPEQDGALTLEEAGLVPNASLNVIVQMSSTAEEVVAPPLVPTTANPTPDRQEEVHGGVHVPMEVDQDVQTRRDAAWAAILARGEEAARMDMDIPLAQVPQEPAGTNNQEQEPLPRRPDREAIQQAIQARLARAPVEPLPPSSAATKRQKTVPPVVISSLRDQCLHIVGNALTTYQHSLLHKTMTHSIGELLLQELIRNKQLDKTTFKAFVNCPLSNIVLDNYVLASDALLELICSHHRTSVDTLSVRGCLSLSDACMESIGEMKHLTTLDLSFCRITERACLHIQDLRELNVLRLAGTKITASTVQLLGACCSSLTTLDLSKCDLSTGEGAPLLLEYLQPLPQLQWLSLESTQLQCPLRVPPATNGRLFPQLTYLNGSGTNLMDADVSDIAAKCTNFTELYMKGCPHITLDGVSRVLGNCKHLQTFTWPSKAMDVDRVMPLAAQLPLTTLDMEFQKLSDVGLHTLSALSLYLTKLNLQQTLITDEGMSVFRDLPHLTELQLDRNEHVTDEGARYLVHLPMLEVLGMSATGITNHTLRFFYEHMARFRSTLREWNLARTAVTEEGVAFIKGYDKLQLLNLFETPVDQEKCERHLRGLPELKSVRYPIHVPEPPPVVARRGAQPPAEWMEEEDDDEQA